MDIISNRKIVVKGKRSSSAEGGDETITVKPDPAGAQKPTELTIKPQVCVKCMSVLAGLIGASAMRFGGPAKNWPESIGFGLIVGAVTAASIHYGMNKS